MIQTGLPRHSTVIFSPGFSALMSTSTGAPAALARSDGVKLATNGTAASHASDGAGAAGDAMIQVRRAGSTGWVTHGFLEG